MAPVIDDDPRRPCAVPDPGPDAARRHWHANLRLTALLLAAWLVVAFVLPGFARDLAFPFFGWPFGFWLAAQGGTCVFVLLIVAYAFGMRRIDRRFSRRALEGASTKGNAPTTKGTSPARHAPDAPDASDAPPPAPGTRRPR